MARRVSETAGIWLRETLPRWFGIDVPGTSAPKPGQTHDPALAPGVPVEVHDERSPLCYLAKPLTDYFSRSMRED